MQMSFYSDKIYKKEGITVILFLFMFSLDRKFTLPCWIVPICNIRNFTLFCAADKNVPSKRCTTTANQARNDVNVFRMEIRILNRFYACSSLNDVSSELRL
jgi:hypothetical protein